MRIGTPTTLVDNYFPFVAWNARAEDFCAKCAKVDDCEENLYNCKNGEDTIDEGTGDNDVERGAYIVDEKYPLEEIENQVNNLDIPLMGLSIFILDVAGDGSCNKFDITLTGDKDAMITGYGSNIKLEKKYDKILDICEHKMSKKDQLKLFTDSNQFEF
jgi:hypothetical protein